MDLANCRLAELLKPQGFKAKRNCFIRKTECGALQFVKFEYEPWLSRNDLRIGLYSLYSELNPHWLTPTGCILHYPVVALANKSKDETISRHTQLDVLQGLGIPWLNAMQTQRDLVVAMCEIEIRENGRIMWIDSLKLAPFLFCKDYVSADHAIAAILQQHTGPAAWTTEPWSENDFEIYQERYPGKDLKLIKIHKWIRDREHGFIESYLQDNFAQNSSILKL